MIFKIHYFSFNAGLSGVLVLITVFLRKYSDATSTEVGALLMALPFAAVLTKPYFCALADRRRAHRLYLILALLFTLLGFGAYAVLPFCPEFRAHHARAAWYLLAAATVVGHLAYGVVWSLGDACAANVAHRTGESFGMIRLWGTVGWGVAGALVGALSPYFHLPEMVLGLLVFIVTHVFEILLLIWWPQREDFEMGDAQGPPTPASRCATITQKPPLATLKQAPPLPPPPPPLEERALEAAQLGQAGAEAAAIELSKELEAGSLRVWRTPSNSLAIMTKVKLAAPAQLASFEASLNRLVADCCKPSTEPMPLTGVIGLNHLAQLDHLEREQERKRLEGLQTIIFKLLVRRHKSLLKYLALFVALGAVYNVHWSYFFLHLDRLAADSAAAGDGAGADFASLVGLCLVAQAVGETLCFAIAPWVIEKLGRDGTISLNAITFALRYFGNGLGIPLISPYVAIATESLQGINYGIFYYLITDTALHYALLVDEIIPELQASGQLDKTADLSAVRTSLRATMQGVFSGAFDGLGFGLGSLVAGLLLERHSYEQLWCWTGSVALGLFVAHALYELVSRRLRQARSYRREIERLERALK